MYKAVENLLKSRMRKQAQLAWCHPISDAQKSGIRQIAHSYGYAVFFSMHGHNTFVDFQKVPKELLA